MRGGWSELYGGKINVANDKDTYFAKKLLSKRHLTS